MIRPLDRHGKLIRPKPLKHDSFSPRKERVGIRRMTVCVAAIADNCIVCVADKALAHGDRIQWESDCFKIFDLRGQAIAMFASDSEAHLTRLAHPLSEIEDYRCSRADLIQSLEEKFRKALEQVQISEVLIPQMLSKELYINTITDPSGINDYMIRVAREVQKCELSCDALFCGYDASAEPYILHMVPPGVVTDMTGVGFHAVGGGSLKAVAQLLFIEHKRTADAARTLYESFDAKVSAETVPGAGETWDACFLAPDGPHVANDELKTAVRRAWSKFNRSPLDAPREPGDDIPENWREDLAERVDECLRQRRRIRRTVIQTPSFTVVDETEEVTPADVVVFARYHDRPPSPRSRDDSNQPGDPAAAERS